LQAIKAMKKQRWSGSTVVLLVGMTLVGACGEQGAASSGPGDSGTTAGGSNGEGGETAAGGAEAREAGCDNDERRCDGVCVDLDSDAQNCGECGAVCAAKHAVGSCSAGACVLDRCDDGFVDCNGEPADGCEARDDGLPDAPRLLSPPVGHNTGSALSDAARTPELRWTPAAGRAGSCGAVTYQVQMDDSCEAGKACGFESPELDVAGIEEPRYRAQDPLEVATTAPVGSRYFWRVRACEIPNRCSDWTDARYLNVGRLSDDLNGDGNSDLLAVSYDGESGKHLHLHPGPLVPASDGASGGALRPTLNLLGPVGFYGSARFVGDVNGDGFSDAIRGLDDGAELLLGNRDFEKISTLKLPAEVAGTHAVTSLGDWDGDGFADFATSDNVTADMPASVVHVYAGNAEAMWTPTRVDAPTGTTAASFGTALAGGLDFDGDGYTDLFILDGNEGRVHFVAGGPEQTGKVKASLATDTACEYYSKPNLVRAGDMNGDGYGDLAVRCDRRLMVFAGGRTPELTPIWTHQFSEDGAALGHGITGGADLGSDGFADLLVHGDDTAGQNLFMLAGSATLSDAAELVPFRGALSKDGQAPAGDGLSDGDFDGVGRPDLLVQVKAVGELRVFSSGKTMSGSCAAADESAMALGDWCRSAVTTIEGKYASDSNPEYWIGGSFGAILAQ
jgi:hypothetical protein